MLVSWAVVSPRSWVAVSPLNCVAVKAASDVVDKEPSCAAVNPLSGNPVHRQAAFFLPWSRLWELSLGATLAISQYYRQQRPFPAAGLSEARPGPASILRGVERF